MAGRSLDLPQKGQFCCPHCEDSGLERQENRDIGAGAICPTPICLET